MTTTLKRCEGKDILRNPIMLEEKELIDMFKGVLSKCTSWKVVSKTIPLMGAGSYGAVYDVVFEKPSGHKKEIALKVIILGEKGLKYNKLIKKESIDEIRFGRMMSKAKIGPRIYSEFLYENKNDDGLIIEYIFILMEKFQGSATDFLDNSVVTRKLMKQPLTLKHKEMIIRKMMRLSRSMLSHQLYCWDIKPGNFVVNVTRHHDIKVRMIDFGGQFCIFGPEQRDMGIANLRKFMRSIPAANSPSPAGRAFWKGNVKSDATLLFTLNVKQFDEIFYSLIMLPFLWILYELDIHSEKMYLQGVADGTWVGAPYKSFLPSIKKAARPLLKKICHDGSLRLGMAGLCVVSPAIFKTFQHYTASLSPIPFSPMAHFKVVLQELCFQLSVSPKKTRRAKSHRRRKTRRQPNVSPIKV